MKTLFKISMIASIVVLVTSCCNCGKGSPKIGDLEKNEWRLIEFDGKETPSSGITITFDGNKKMLYGQVPCNNFFAGYSLFDNAEQNIKIGNAGRTQKFCPNSELEDRFAGSIMKITKVKIDGGNLLMINSEGKLMAVLAPVVK